ncbi:hypothetical protein SAMN05428981_11015 [Bacillus sp. OV194]|nr:hypothetical protein SAMN05428981_11015 [Bacillus sp. OV194]
MGKRKYSKGEIDFIRGCTRAILANHGKFYHSLFDVNGVRMYVTHKGPYPQHYHAILRYGRCICCVNPNTIEDWYHTAIGDESAKLWITRGLRNLIAHGESVSSALSFYKKGKMNKETFLRSISTEGLNEEDRRICLNNIETILFPKS